MKIPIAKLLKTRVYREMAAFQDDVVDILYRTDNTIIIHGGTAVWRCYGGSRFSDDIDAYISSGRLEELKEKIRKTAFEHGVVVQKIKDTGNVIFIGLSLEDKQLKVEINHQKKNLKPTAARFERTDGTYMEVLTLTPEDLILEKINAYQNRLLIRDVYDIYILANQVSDNKKIKENVLQFLKKLKPPVNEETLPSLIYVGPAPSFETMIRHIKGALT